MIIALATKARNDNKKYNKITICYKCRFNRACHTVGEDKKPGHHDADAARPPYLWEIVRAFLEAKLILIVLANSP